MYCSNTMETSVVILLLGIIIAVHGQAAPDSQPNCDAFSAITSPCDAGSNKVMYYPHPSDQTKFLQCQSGQLMIVQCPPSEIYNQASEACGQATATTPPPIHQTVTNPCGAQHILDTGKTYFAYPDDMTKFIQCTSDGVAIVLPCPTGQRWNEDRLSCVYIAINVTPDTPVTQPPVLDSGVKNPCTEATLIPNQNTSIYFAHPNPNKFIECGVSGMPQVMDCPAGLVWNEASLTCISVFFSQVRPTQASS